MTVANNYAPVVATANGTTTAFSGSWNAISASYLVVQLLNTTTGAYTTVYQGVGVNQYQVTSLTSSGFGISFNTAPASGYEVVISRKTTQQQTVPYTTSRGFQGSVEEGSFDALTNMMQELSYQSSNSINAPVGDTATSLQLPIASLRAGYVLAFDSSGNVIVSTQTLTQIQAGSTAAAGSATAAAASAANASSSASTASTAATAAAASAASAAAVVTVYDTTGTANNYVVNPSPAVTLTDKTTVFVRSNVTNTSSSTINVSSTGAVPLRAPDGSALAAGEFPVGCVAELIYNSGSSSWFIGGYRPTRAAIVTGTIDGTTIGATTPSTIKGTTGNFSGLITAPAGINPNASGGVTLNDVDAGTWTPALLGVSTAGSPTYSVQIGIYRRTNNTVFIAARVQLTALGGMAGQLAMSGLPFTCQSSVACALSPGELVNAAASTYILIPEVQPSTTQAYIFKQASAGTSPFSSSADITSTLRMWLSGTYAI